MSHYKELKKIRRDSGGGLIYETIISEDYKKKEFTSGHHHKRVELDKERTTMKITRDYGAGVRVEIARISKGRIYAQGVSLGKSEIEMLKEFIAMVEPELSDYNGTYEPTQLVDLTKK